MSTIAFGSFLKEYRLKAGFGLRQFAKEVGLQPSNLSNIEHGRLKPPQDREILMTIATVLGFEDGTAEWNSLYDLAAKENSKVLPADVADFLGGVSGVPVLFREIKDRKITSEDMDDLVNYIRSHYSK